MRSSRSSKVAVHKPTEIPAAYATRFTRKSVIPLSSISWAAALEYRIARHNRRNFRDIESVVFVKTKSRPRAWTRLNYLCSTSRPHVVQVGLPSAGPSSRHQAVDGGLMTLAQPWLPPPAKRIWLTRASFHKGRSRPPREETVALFHNQHERRCYLLREALKRHVPGPTLGGLGATEE